MLRQESAGPSKGITAVALGAALAALGGCAASQAAQQRPSPATVSRAEGADHEHGQQTRMMAMCPMRVPGTTVSVSDTEGGVAVVFKTTGEVTELSHRVRHMADMHNRHHAEKSHDGMVPATAAAEDVEGGARIVLTLAYRPSVTQWIVER